MKSNAPPSGWIDYITKLPITKYDRVKLKPAEQTISTEDMEKPATSTFKQVKF